MWSKRKPIPALGHSLHFGSVSMSGLPPTTTEWPTFENGRNMPTGDISAKLFGAARYTGRPAFRIPSTRCSKHVGVFERQDASPPLD